MVNKEDTGAVMRENKMDMEKVRGGEGVLECEGNGRIMRMRG